MKHMLFIFVIAIISAATALPAVGQPISPFGTCKHLDDFFFNQEAHPMDTVLTLVENTGIKWLRIDFFWEWIERDSAVYDSEMLSMYDRLIHSVRERDMQIYGILHSNEFETCWSTGTFAPANEKQYQDFANFVSFVVNRYKDNINYWEIWNEPDGDEYWKPEPNASQYAQLLKHAYRSVKSADSSAQVIGCVTAPSNLEFLSRAFQDSALDYMDIISVHPYCWNEPGSYSIFEISFQYNSMMMLRDSMKTYGAEKPMWVSEIGYPVHSGQYAINEERQAKLLARSYLLLLASGIGQISWYVLLEGENNPFGIVDSAFTPKPAYYAYKTMVQIIDNHVFSEEIPVDESTKAFLFQNDSNQQVMTIWSFDENYVNDSIVFVEKDVKFIFDGTIDQIMNIYGNPVPFSVEDNTLDLHYSNTPLYIIGNFTIIDAVVVAVDTYNPSHTPEEIQLLQNYPNPLNPSTKISYTLPEPGYVELEIYNIMGQRVKTLVSSSRTTGYHHVTWRSNNLAGGVYFYRLQVMLENGRHHLLTKKLMVIN